MRKRIGGAVLAAVVVISCVLLGCLVSASIGVLIMFVPTLPFVAGPQAHWIGNGLVVVGALTGLVAGVVWARAILSNR
jgi:hypothetical protein